MLNFDNLLIATGSSPLRPSIPGADLPGVLPLWSLTHTDNVLKYAASLQPAGRTPRVVLVGAGFIGFIVLNAMYKRKWQLAVVEREGQVLPRMLDAPAADHVRRWLAAQEVAVHCGATVRQIRPEADGAKAVVLSDGRSLTADIVILATGIRPNLDLLQGSGIATGEAILVNDRMQTNFPHLYAGGDVAQGPVLFGAERAVHPIQPTAVDHGRVAGANMAGHEVRYPGSLLMNVVDICGLQGASFGRWDDAAAEAMTIDNPAGFIFRKLLWTDDRITGALFAGQANDLGMLTDIGMVKGLMQTQTRLGPWKKYLRGNPFDIRRAYIGCGVAAKLAGTTLLGRPAKARQYRFGVGGTEGAGQRGARGVPGERLTAVCARLAHAVVIAMKIRLKLMGTLKGSTPPGGALEVADGATIGDVLHALGITSPAIRVFTVNGQFERDRSRVLGGERRTHRHPAGRRWLRTCPNRYST